MRYVEIFQEVRIAGVGIGRIEENKVGDEVASGEFIEATHGVGCDYFYAGANIEGCEVLAHQANAVGIAVNEENFARASADGFDSDCASAGVQVDEERVFDGRAENVEERFAQAVAGGADAQEPWSSQLAAAVFSGDYAHDLVRRGTRQFTPAS